MKRLKRSILLNEIVVFFVVIGCFFMFTGIKFMPGKNLLSVSTIEMFKFYTVDSNILVGIISLIMVIYERKLLSKQISEIPRFVYVLKSVAATAISITFLVTLFLLTPKFGFFPLYNNSNLFFHFLVPVLVVVSYLFYEKYESRYSDAIYGMIPLFLYSIYYAGMVFLHMGETTKYDFYGLLNGDINNAYIIIPGMYLFCYVLGISLIFLNKKLAKGD